MSDVISSDDPVFGAYIFYSSVLILKMIAMQALTVRQRLKAFKDPEEAAKKGLISPEVERIRKAHLNDLENIPVFLFAAWLFQYTKPCSAVAVNLFRIYTASRIAHSAIYISYFNPQQPTRFLVWLVGIGITSYMGLRTLIHYL